MEKIVAGICDDSRIWCRQAAEILKEYGDSRSLDIQVVCFESEEQLFSYNGRALDVLFMDIELSGKEGACRNGIEAAERVNALWRDCQVVYLTNYLYYATEVYGTVHAYFVLKEQFQTKIDAVFQKLLHQFQQKEKRLIFSVIGKNEIVLSPDEIICFERRGRVTDIHTVRGIYEIWDKLEVILQKVPELDFFRCHNSYIVYFPAVSEMRKDCFIMNNGMEVMISRSYAKKVKTAFMEWALTQM